MRGDKGLAARSRTHTHTRTHMGAYRDTGENSTVYYASTHVHNRQKGTYQTYYLEADLGQKKHTYIHTRINSYTHAHAHTQVVRKGEETLTQTHGHTPARTHARARPLTRLQRHKFLPNSARPSRCLQPPAATHKQHAMAEFPQ